MAQADPQHVCARKGLTSAGLAFRRLSKHGAQRRCLLYTVHQLKEHITHLFLNSILQPFWPRCSLPHLLI